MVVIPVIKSLWPSIQPLSHRLHSLHLFEMYLGKMGVTKQEEHREKNPGCTHLISFSLVPPEGCLTQSSVPQGCRIGESQLDAEILKIR